MQLISTIQIIQVEFSVWQNCEFYRSTGLKYEVSLQPLIEEQNVTRERFMLSFLFTMDAYKLKEKKKKINAITKDKLCLGKTASVYTCISNHP